MFINKPESLEPKPRFYSSSPKEGLLTDHAGKYLEDMLDEEKALNIPRGHISIYEKIENGKGPKYRAVLHNHPLKKGVRYAVYIAPAGLFGEDPPMESAPDPNYKLPTTKEGKRELEAFVDAENIFLQAQRENRIDSRGKNAWSTAFKSASWGATVGGGIGFVAGSIVPGIGNVIGGAVGAAVGGFFGLVGGYFASVFANERADDKQQAGLVRKQLAERETRLLKSIEEVSEQPVTRDQKEKSVYQKTLIKNRVEPDSPIPEVFGQPRAKLRAITPLFYSIVVPGTRNSSISVPSRLLGYVTQHRQRATVTTELLFYSQFFIIGNGEHILPSSRTNQAGLHLKKKNPTNFTRVTAPDYTTKQVVAWLDFDINHQFHFSTFFPTLLRGRITNWQWSGTYVADVPEELTAEGGITLKEQTIAMVYGGRRDTWPSPNAIDYPDVPERNIRATDYPLYRWDDSRGYSRRYATATITNASDVSAFNTAIRQYNTDVKNLNNIQRAFYEQYSQELSTYNENKSNFKSFAKDPSMDVQRIIYTLNLSGSPENTFSSAKASTDNPADIAAHILKETIKRSKIPLGFHDVADVDEWRDWKRFCTAKGLRFDFVFDYDGTAVQALELVFKAGMAEMDMSFEKLRPVWAREREDYPCQIFHARNIANLTYTKKGQKIPDRITGSYINPNKGHKKDEVYVYTTGAPAGVSLTGGYFSVTAGTPKSGASGYTSSAGNGYSKAGSINTQENDKLLGIFSEGGKTKVFVKSSVPALSKLWIGADSYTLRSVSTNQSSWGSSNYDYYEVVGSDPFATKKQNVRIEKADGISMQFQAKLRTTTNWRDQLKMELEFVDDASLAMKHIQLQKRMLEELYELWSFETDVMALACRTGDRVGLSHYEIHKAQFTARIYDLITDASGKLTGIQIDQESLPKIEEGKTYACCVFGPKEKTPSTTPPTYHIAKKEFEISEIKMQAAQTSRQDIKNKGAVLKDRTGDPIFIRAVKKNTLVLKTPELLSGMDPAPEKGNYIFFGEKEEKYIDCLVKSISVDSNLRASVSLIRYVKEIYDF